MCLPCPKVSCVPLVLMIIRKLVSIIRMHLCALWEKVDTSEHNVTHSHSLWMTVQCDFKDQLLLFIVGLILVCWRGRLITPSGSISFSQIFIDLLKWSAVIIHSSFLPLLIS